MSNATLTQPITSQVHSVRTLWNSWNTIKNEYNKIVETHEDEDIPTGLLLRLAHYGKKQLLDSGFTQAAEWPIEVYTMDGNEPRSSRTYYARFTNDKEAYIEVIGIHCNNGWPSVDHGFEINRG